MITTTYTIDDLTMDGVSVMTQRYYDGDALGQPHRKAYLNSVNGRNELQEELPTQYVNAIFTVWGEKATITDDSEI